jgi:hypothetical protein
MHPATPTQAATARDATTRPTLRDRSMGYAVRYLFGDTFEVSGNGRRYYVRATWFEGDVLASCKCPDKIINKAAQCKHELAVVRFERVRVAQAQGF